MAAEYILNYTGEEVDRKLRMVDENTANIGRLTNLIGTLGSSSTSIQTYITEDIGELYLAPTDYTAWCPCTLHFDKSIDKFVSLVYGAPAHVHSKSELYVTYIDKETYASTELTPCKYVDSDGVTDITPDVAGTCSFIILKDGTYLMIHFANDGNTHRFISDDKGITWKSTGVITGGFNCPWYITELSNGRLICSDDATKVGFAYSDDKGFNWTTVVPTSCGGGYEAEACILEVEEGKLIAIGRYSMSGMGYYESGDSEHAIISFSEDYGTTWTPWKISETIDNMNASSCTGIAHNGIVEIFTTSRWYSNGSNVNTDNANTGKNGAMMHYTATIENALNDNFTKKGILDYAKGAGGEYHSPCLEVDDNKNILICHMDGGSSTTCTHRYLRGSLDNLDYLAKDGSGSVAKAYSAKYMETRLGSILEKVNELQFALSQLPESGVTPPTGTLVWTKTFDASTATDVIHRDTESDFYPYTECNSYPTSTTIHTILTDDDNELTMKTFSYLITIPIEKENCAVLVKAKPMGDAAGNVTVNLYMNNICYSVGLYRITYTDYQELKFEYKGGKLTITRNGTKIKSDSTEEITSDSKHYGVNKVVIGKTSNNYCYYRTIKFGEWDSE